MKIDVYTRIPNRVQAVQLTPETADEIALWCGGKVDRNEKPGDPSDVSVHLFVPNIDGVLTANASMKPFIVKDSDGRFSIRGGEKFLGEYEKPTREMTPREERIKDAQDRGILPTAPLTPHYVTRGAYPNV